MLSLFSKLTENNKTQTHKIKQAQNQAQLLTKELMAKKTELTTKDKDITGKKEEIKKLTETTTTLVCKT